jgi:hypothetical protein
VELELFDGGPPSRLEVWLRIRKPGDHAYTREALLAGTAAWLPLLLLVVPDADALRSFLADIAVHARYLVALPMLMLAESLCRPRLSALARHFAQSGLVTDADRTRFEATTESTRRRLDSPIAEVGVILLAYVAALGINRLAAVDMLPPWQVSSNGFAGRSPAGLWHVAVSMPVLLIFVFGWLWRLLLWGRFLRLMSHLDLRLLASHPDRCGGLHFVSQSPRAFAVPAAGLSVIMAGGLMGRILREGPLPLTFMYVVVGTATIMLLLFASPLLVFSGKLLRHWNKGMLEYGALAHRVGRDFERAWLEEGSADAEDPLGSQAFSATADLYQVVENVYGMRIVPMDATGLLLFAGATLLPFIPALLLMVPTSVLLEKVAGVLL